MRGPGQTPPTGFPVVEALNFAAIPAVNLRMGSGFLLGAHSSSIMKPLSILLVEDDDWSCRVFVRCSPPVVKR